VAQSLLDRQNSRPDVLERKRSAKRLSPMATPSASAKQSPPTSGASDGKGSLF
jgi:hypothetical protein